MLFAHDGNVEKALLDSIENSIKQRETDMCNTWNPGDVMALPWGVKENVEPEYGDKVEAYVSKLEGSEVTLSSGQVVKIIKAGVKERKGEYVLIFRYQIV